MPKPGGFLENKCGKPKPIGVFLHGLIDHELPSTTFGGSGFWEPVAEEKHHAAKKTKRPERTSTGGRR